MDSRCLAALDAYGLAARVVRIEPLGSGHIHRTYAVGMVEPSEAWVLQELNRQVFPDLEPVMQNIIRVTDHLRQKAEARGEAVDRVTLSFRSTATGATWVGLADGSAWRLSRRIRDAVPLEPPASPDRIAAAAWAFGRFAADLADLPTEGLHEVLPDFHHTPRRLAALEASFERDAVGRAEPVRDGWAFVQERRRAAAFLVEGLAARTLPLRVVHQDTKYTNVLMDAASGAPICVIDLDTVMPGSPLVDLGDGMRAVALPGDGPVDFEAMGAFARGWLEGVGGLLTEAERILAPRMPWLLALELGARFLTDHLEGDRYFRIQRPGHNLERALAQFRLVSALEANPADVTALFS